MKFHLFVFTIYYFYISLTICKKGETISSFGANIYTLLAAY